MILRPVEGHAFGSAGKELSLVTRGGLTITTEIEGGFGIQNSHLLAKRTVKLRYLKRST